MTFTIEPMLNLGTHEWDMWDDGWTVVTKDRRRSAQFEHTLLVTDTGAEILTCPEPLSTSAPRAVIRPWHGRADELGRAAAAPSVGVEERPGSTGQGGG